MSINLGTISTSNFMLGNIQVDKIYLGTQLVWTNELDEVTLTIRPTPSDATVVLTADGYEQEGNSITVAPGTEVTYTVSKEHYITVSSTYTVETTETLNISLTLENHTLTINTTPSDANVTFSTGTVSQDGHSTTVPYGTTVLYEVSKTDYYSVTGSYEVLSDHTISVTLEQIYYVDVTDYQYTQDANGVVELTNYIGAGTTPKVPGLEE